MQSNEAIGGVEMKKIFIAIILTTLSLNAWEVNTHRAIDRKAIESSVNLQTFVNNSGIPKNNTYYNNEEFEGYGMTYLKYITDKEYGEGNGISQWYQVFSGKPSYQNMIEAGTILEDAVWAGGLFSGDGRFNNHFYDPQNGGKGLTVGWGSRTDALTWAWGNATRSNQYDYLHALEYFKQGFTSATPEERKKFQAKMLVSVGHILHLMNDMNVPAHTRDDAHPFGDALEWWARGGEDGSSASGFHIVGSKPNATKPDMDSVPDYKFGDYNSLYFGELYGYMKKEAEFTSTHFFSGYSINTFLDQIDTIGTKEYPKNYHEEPCRDSDVSNVGECYIVSDELASHKKLAIRVKSYFYNALHERIDGIDLGTQMHGGSMTEFRGDMSVLEDNA